jgi:uncharacterized protein (DUF2336 family)
MRAWPVWHSDMSAPASLIRELEKAIQNRSPRCRATMVTRIGALFVARADFNADHIRVFDQVLSRLLMDVEVGARRELAQRLAPLDNAPVGAIRLLARDDAIEVAGPILERSPRLAEDDLVDIAASKGQAHLLAISRRADIAEPVSELLVRRGGREVLRNVAENSSARLTDDGFFRLVEGAGNDAVLAEKVGSRPDLPPHLFSDLLRKATNTVAKHQPASGPPQTSQQPQAARKCLRAVAASGGAADQAAPQCVSETLRRGKLDEAAILKFAINGQNRDLISALACLCAVPIEVVERLMGSERPDPVLILCKSAGWGWETAKAVLKARPAGARISGCQLDAAFADFERLPSSTARRARRFWQFTLTHDETATPE